MTIGDFILLAAEGREYRIAFVRGSDGEFVVAHRFLALDDESANAYAEERYGDEDWYVLDSTGRNINGEA